LATTRLKDGLKMKNIAIIGSGISGLTCAHLLDPEHNVTVYEKNHYVGGHTATIDIEHKGEKLAIDTGFIVFNNRTYPNFIRLLDKLGVNKKETEMSFSVHNPKSGFEYNGHTINTLFAQRRNLLKPRFWKLIFEIVKFNRLCKKAFHENDFSQAKTLGDFLAKQGFSSFFAEHYILPMGAAIWSTSLQEMEAFELKFFIQFFFHHGLLNIVDRPQWYVVEGGSRSYVSKITDKLNQAIQLNTDIRQVTRQADGVHLLFANGDEKIFDEVIFSCHSDQALQLLGDASLDEKAILAGIPYSPNQVTLHTDTKLLPKRKLAWASWNYRLDKASDHPACVTYIMNILQGIKNDSTFCVTLNQDAAIDPDKIIQSFTYHHPILNTQSVGAQNKRHLICGKNNTHFVGAYWYNGFHEDGVKSALDVTKRFGAGL
jgi:predicted NAD/FAD-binding protein